MKNLSDAERGLIELIRGGRPINMSITSQAGVFVVLDNGDITGATKSRPAMGTGQTFAAAWAAFVRERDAAAN